MKRITKIALVLLVCALLLGVGGGFLLASEKGVSINEKAAVLTATSGSEAYFGCPDHDPDCQPGKP